MAFFLDKNASREELTDAVNYLLANFTQAKIINPNSGEISAQTTGTSGYLYRYLSLKYADSWDGQVNFSNSPTNRLYYGIYNADAISEPTDYSKYLWIKVPGGLGTTKFVWYCVTGSRQIQILVDTSKPFANYVPDSGYAIDLDLLTTASLDDLTLSVDVVGTVKNLIDELKQEPQPQLGTMAALQQDNLPYLVMDTSPIPPPVPPVPGAMWWNSTGTLNLKMGNNIITQQIGEEFFQYGKASSAINDANTQLIYKTGTVGASGVITFAPTIAGITDTDLIIGIATEPLALNAFGRVTTMGTVNGINTSGSAYGETWVDNDDIWYNPVTGGLTKTKPVAPNVKLQVGTVINAGSGGSGSFYVKIAGSSILGGTDANVQLGTLVSGDSLVYDGVLGYWINKQASALSGVPITKTANFTVAPGETWFINNKSGSTCTVTLTAASIFPGRTLHFQNYQAQTLVSATSNVVPIVGGAAGTAILANVAGDCCTLVSDGTNWIITKYTPNNILLLE